MCYYKRFDKSDHMGSASEERTYEGYKAIQGAIVGNDKKGEFVLVKTEDIDEFVMLTISGEDFRVQGYNPDKLTKENMQNLADRMAHNYIMDGAYSDEIEDFAEDHNLEPYKNEEEED